MCLNIHKKTSLLHAKQKGGWKFPFYKGLFCIFPFAVGRTLRLKFKSVCYYRHFSSKKQAFWYHFFPNCTDKYTAVFVAPYLCIKNIPMHKLRVCSEKLFWSPWSPSFLRLFFSLPWAFLTNMPIHASDVFYFIPIPVFLVLPTSTRPISVILSLHVCRHMIFIPTKSYFLS